MEFCKKCGNLMIVGKKNGKLYNICRNCGYSIKADNAVLTKISEKITQEDEKIKVMKAGDEYQGYPVTNEECPKCGNNKAYWYMQQTRGADEAQTKFFCCTKCKCKWREYD